MAGMLIALVMIAPPARTQTEFEFDGKVLIVVGFVQRPFDAQIPRKIVISVNDRTVEHGWVWQGEFGPYKYLNVCYDREGEVYLVPTYMVRTK